MARRTEPLPDQTGNSGKFLTTDGSTASWAAAAGSGDMTKAVYDTNDDGIVNEASAVEGTGVKSTGETGGTKFLREDGDGTCSWQAATATVAAADITDATVDGIALITSADANPFTDADESKLDGIEASADVTDTTNVTAAGALMDSEVDADIKTLSLPANTTISAFGATLVDDADAATARATLDVDQAGTDNSTDVTLDGVPDYITITGQVITRNQIDLTADVTGVLPEANLPNASETAEGVVELATTAEATTGTDTARAVTPAGVKAVGDTKLALAGGTMTGNITLGENTSVDLDASLSADGKYSGVAIDGTAGATLAFGDLVYLQAGDSRWELADASAAGTAGTVLLGICVLAASGDGEATKVLLQGTVRADTAFPALTIGGAVYAGETAGDVVTTAPTTADAVVRVLGHGLTADSMYFAPSASHITHTG